MFLKLIDCVNYPTELYKSYEECDTRFMRSVTERVGVTPFWVTSDYSQVTRHFQPPHGGHFVETLWDLFYGSRASECKKPCKYRDN